MSEPSELPPVLRDAAIAVARLDLRGHIIDVNRALSEAAGYSSDELRGRSFAEFIEGPDTEARASFLALASGAIDTYRGERRYRTRAGDARDVELRVSLVRDDRGRPHGCLAVLQDITPAKRALREVALRAAELEAVIQSMPAAVVIGDDTGVKLANKKALEQFGYNSVDEMDVPVSRIAEQLQARDVVTGEPLPADRLSFSRALRGEHVDNEVRVTHLRTGDASIQRVIAAPIVWDGRTVGAVAIYIDVTDRVAADEKRKLAEVEQERLLADAQRARAEAEAAGRVKDEFLAMLSHELRTPLNAVLGWARILRSRPIGEQAAHAVTVIERNAAAQARLIDDLLDVSRIITGKIRLNLEPVDVRFVAAGALESVRPAAEAKRIRIDLQVADHVPPVNADAQRLQQVFWNLLSNAVKFTEPDGHVSVTVTSDDAGVRAEVRDTGMGIPAEILPFVFDRFMQGDSSSTRAHSGLGLGLAIVRHLIELHGGTVRAESPGRGHGASFHFFLPLPR